MRLSNRENAYPPPKVSGYPLAETHAIGLAKALVLGNLGSYDMALEDLDRDLLP